MRTVALTAALFTLASVAHAQTTVDTVFSDNFETGYTYPTELTQGETTVNETTGGTGPTGWITTDPDNPTLGDQSPSDQGYVANFGNPNGTDGGYVGGTNFVGRITGFVDGHGAYLGGGGRTNYDPTITPDPSDNFDTLPGASTTYLYHPFTINPTSSSYTFAVDSSIIQSSTNPNTLSGAQDSFAYTFRTSTGAVLFSINFNKTPGSTTTDTISYSVGTSTTQNGSNNPGNVMSVTLNARYHFAITVNTLTDTFSLTYNGNGAPAGDASTPFLNASLAGAALGLNPVLPINVNQVAASWTLSDTTHDLAGAYYNAGSNYLAFDNYNVTSVDLVPEPSALAMMGAGLLGLIGVMKLRSRQA